METAVAVYPYSPATGAVGALLLQVRKSFPARLDADYLRKFGIAPANESYLITIMKFLGFIDEEGNKVDAGTEFFLRNDEEFRTGLGSAIKSAYTKLFEEHGEDAWSVSREALTQWFRVEDKTSEVIGKRQAATFLALAAAAGHAPGHSSQDASARRSPASSRGQGKTRNASKRKGQDGDKPRDVAVEGSDTEGRSAKDTRAVGSVGLSVRIEVNLPTTADPQVYDAIFASIRRHFVE